jgi:hypothetical protein
MTAEFIGAFWLVFAGCGSAVLAAAFPNVGIGPLGMGGKLGSAIQNIDRLATPRGEVPGAKGDHPFRIYAQMKPVAVNVLYKSGEFRPLDDSVHHKGYPICYRGRPEVPSIKAGDE